MPEDPFFFLDQDVINALLASEFDTGDLRVLPHRLAPHPPFSGLSVDAQSLRCRYDDGTEPFLLHHVMRKPWLESVPSNPYSQLFSRLLLADDVPIRVQEKLLQRRLRRDLLAKALRSHLSIADRLTSTRRLIMNRARNRHRPRMTQRV